MIKLLSNIISRKNPLFYERFTAAHHKILEEAQHLPQPRDAIDAKFLGIYGFYLTVNLEFFFALFYGFRDGSSPDGEPVLTLEELRAISPDQGYGLFCYLLVGFIRYSLVADRELAASFVAFVSFTTSKYAEAGLSRLSERMASENVRECESTLINLIAEFFPRTKADPTVYMRVAMLLATYAGILHQNLKNELLDAPAVFPAGATA